MEEKVGERSEKVGMGRGRWGERWEWGGEGGEKGGNGEGRVKMIDHLSNPSVQVLLTIVFLGNLFC